MNVLSFFYLFACYIQCFFTLEWQQVVSILHIVKVYDSANAILITLDVQTFLIILVLVLMLSLFNGEPCS